VSVTNVIVYTFSNIENLFVTVFLYLDVIFFVSQTKTESGNFCYEHTSTEMHTNDEKLKENTNLFCEPVPSVVAQKLFKGDKIRKINICICFLATNFS